ALFVAPVVESTWSIGETMVMMAGAWVLHAAFAADRAGQHLGLATNDRGVRIARALYGLGLIPFGYAHFANVKDTAALVPGWLPWPVAWAHFTGATFIAAGLAILMGVCAPLAAALSAVQMGVFGLLVWVPLLAAGSATAFSWDELLDSLALAAGGWVVAESYWGVPWLALRARRATVEAS